MTLTTLKKIAILTVVFVILGAILISPNYVTPTFADDFDAAAAYKAKCAMCHGPKAEKKFDPAKTDEQLIEAIIKGKDGTPKMPAYEGKVTTEQAKALVDYMKALRQ